MEISSLYGTWLRGRVKAFKSLRITQTKAAKTLHFSIETLQNSSQFTITQFDSGLLTVQSANSMLSIAPWDM